MTYVPRHASPKQLMPEMMQGMMPGMMQGMMPGMGEPTPAGPPMDDMPIEEPPMRSVLNPQMAPMPMQEERFPRVLNHGQPEDGMTPSGNIRKIIEMRRSGKW